MTINDVRSTDDRRRLNDARSANDNMIAITRKPGKNFSQGITVSNLGKADFEKVLVQHAAYCEALIQCGLEVITLEADERYPDGCFVEDTAVVTPEVAVITRPGAESRRGEEHEIRKVLEKYRKTEQIRAPGTLDGGDILRADRHFYIGLSQRTNREGAAQLAEILSAYGYTSSTIGVEAGLHLKSGIAYLGSGRFIGVEEFSFIAGPSNFILLSPEESYAANCLRINDYLIIPKGFPDSEKRLRALNYNIIELDTSEFRKMDGGLTCLSLLVEM
jgi:dimethylargininase